MLFEKNVYQGSTCFLKFVSYSSTASCSISHQTAVIRGLKGWNLYFMKRLSCGKFIKISTNMVKYSKNFKNNQQNFTLKKFKKYIKKKKLTLSVPDNCKKSNLCCLDSSNFDQKQLENYSNKIYQHSYYQKANFYPF